MPFVHLVPDCRPNVLVSDSAFVPIFWIAWVGGLCGIVSCQMFGVVQVMVLPLLVL